MDPFYYIVLSIAVVMLILVLIFVGILMQSQNANATFPPQANMCPDFWESDASGNCIIPGVKQDTSTPPDFTDPSGQNFGSLKFANGAMKDGDGTTALTISNIKTKYDAGTSIYGVTSASVSYVFINPTKDTDWAKNGLTAICGQRAWCDKYGIQWDGTSNFNGCA